MTTRLTHGLSVQVACSPSSGCEMAPGLSTIRKLSTNGVRGSGEWYAKLEGQLSSMRYFSCPKTPVSPRLQLTHFRRSRFTNLQRPKSHESVEKLDAEQILFAVTIPSRAIGMAG